MGAKPTADATPELAPQDEAPVDLIEISGVIKWFDVAKGYGFIVPDNGMPDVLLHVTCLRRDGFQTAYEGARVVCEVQDRPKGLQAFRVVSMDETTATHPAQMPPTRQRSAVTPTSPLVAATVKWFNRMRGYGFVTEGEGDARHLRPHGDAAPLRHDGAAARPGRAGALRRGHEGPHRRRNPAPFGWPASRLALSSPMPVHARISIAAAFAALLLVARLPRRVGRADRRRRARN